MPGVTIQIIGDTEQAQQALDKFFKGANEAFEKIIGFKEGLETLGKRIVEVFSVTELLKMGKEAIETADQMGKLADALKINVEFLSVLTYGMRQANYGQGELQLGLRQLSSILTEANRGGLEAEETFNRAGVAFQTADGSARGLQPVIKDILGTLSKRSDSVDLAERFFGRNGVAFLKAFRDGEEGLNRLAEAAKRAGQVMGDEDVKRADEFNSALKDLELTVKGIVSRVVIDFLPALTHIADAMKESRDEADAVSKSTSALSFIIKALVTVVRTLWEAFQLLNDVMVLLFAAFIALRTGVKLLDQVFFAIAQSVSAMSRAVVESIKVLGGFGDVAQKLFNRQFGEAWSEAKHILTDVAVVGMKSADSVGFAWSNAWEGVKAASLQGRNALSDLWDGLARKLYDQWQSFSGFISKLWESPEVGGTNKKKRNNNDEEAIRNILKQKQYQDEIARLYIEAFAGRQALLDEEYRQRAVQIDHDIKDTVLADELKLSLWLVYEKKKTTVTRDEAAARQQIELARLQGKVGTIEADKDKDALEKKKLLIPLLKEETSLISDQIKNYRERLADQGLTDEGRIEAEKQLVSLEQQRVEINQKLKDLQAQTFSGQMRQGLAQLATEWGNLGANLANGVMGGIRDAIGGVGDAIVGVINHTKTWGQVFAQVGDRIIASLINIVIQWIANMTIVAALRKIFGLSDKTEAASMASAWAPAAIAASIASYGTAALVGTSAYATALIAGTALTSGMAVAAFAKGGRIPGGKQLIQANEEGQEFVFSAPAYGKAAPFIEALHAGLRNGYDLATAIQAALPTPFTANQGLPIRGSGSGSVNVSPAPVTVAVLNNENQLRRFMESQAAKQIIFKHINEDPRGVGLTR